MWKYLGIIHATSRHAQDNAALRKEWQSVADNPATARYAGEEPEEIRCGDLVAHFSMSNSTCVMTFSQLEIFHAAASRNPVCKGDQLPALNAAMEEFKTIAHLAHAERARAVVPFQR